MPERGWHEVGAEHQWALALIEERLAQTNRSPAELTARARALRAEAAETGGEGLRVAALALARRYEATAAASRSRRR